MVIESGYVRAASGNITTSVHGIQEITEWQRILIDADNITYIHYKDLNYIIVVTPVDDVIFYVHLNFLF